MVSVNKGARKVDVSLTLISGTGTCVTLPAWIGANIDLLTKRPHVGLIGASQSVMEDRNKCVPVSRLSLQSAFRQSNFPESCHCRILPFPTADLVCCSHRSHGPDHIGRFSRGRWGGGGDFSSFYVIRPFIEWQHSPDDNVLDPVFGLDDDELFLGEYLVMPVIVGARYLCRLCALLISVELFTTPVSSDRLVFYPASCHRSSVFGQMKRGTWAEIDLLTKLTLEHQLAIGRKMSRIFGSCKCIACRGHFPEARPIALCLLKG